MINEFLGALFLIFIAEMGDKTQVITMTLALKYPINKILIGVALGSFANHGLAIVLGTMLSRIVPIDFLQLFAGTLFIIFAFYSLKIREEEVEEKKYKYSVIIAVALMFFIGELGDKTQLTALGLGSTSLNPFVILLGTTSGMVLTSFMGIIVGRKLGKKIAEDKIKIASFLVFSFFGLEKIYTNLLVKFITVNIFYVISIIYISLSIFAIHRFIVKYKTVQQSTFKKQAQELYRLKNGINKEIQELCHACEICDEDRCLIGYLKLILEKDGKINKYDENVLCNLLNKSFNIEKSKEALLVIVRYYEKYNDEYFENKLLIMIRNIFEIIIFDKILLIDSLDKYIAKVQ